jgi:hypothetical protein
LETHRPSIELIVANTRDFALPLSRVACHSTALSMARTHVILRAALYGVIATVILGGLIILGSRNLAHFDAALVGYTFATLFAAFGITYRYSMWLQRPPTRMYWRRGWQTFFSARFFLNVATLLRRAVADFAFNRFIFRRGALRGAGHMAIMWGCIIACAITFPLVWGWVHFGTIPGQLETYRVYLFGVAAGDSPVNSLLAFLIFHGLVWAAFFVIAGVMLAFRRRMIDHNAAALQQFGEDILPLILLCAVSVTGLMLTVSYTWMKGYAYEFLAILHAVTVIVTLVWLPFGKLFHIFQRPAQLGVSFYKDAGQRLEQAHCARCEQPFASMAMVTDLTTVERQLGFRYETQRKGLSHYQQICPPCRRALLGLAQSALWKSPLIKVVSPTDEK